jgi:hypothetical protein
VQVTVDAGDTPACTFTNSKDATLDIEKVSVAGTGTFDFVGTGVDNFSRTTTGAGVATITAPIAVVATAFGEKLVKETIPAGWALTNIECTNGNAVVVIGRQGVVDSRMEAPTSSKQATTG